MSYSYAKTKNFNIMKWIFVIAAVFETLICLLFILGMFINTEKDNFLFPTNDVIFVSVLSLMMISALILINTKFKFTSVIIGLLPQIPLAIIFARQCEDPYRLSGVLSIFYWRHLIPIVLMTASLLWILIKFILEIRNEKSNKRIYDKQF